MEEISTEFFTEHLKNVVYLLKKKQIFKYVFYFIINFIYG